MIGPTSATRPESDHVVLHALQVGIARQLGGYASDHVELSRVLDPMAIKLTTMVLTEKLPTEQIREERVARVELVGFATWWDHFKSTYRSRWWMRWRRWDIEYRIKEETLRAAVHVDLRRSYLYPHAPSVAPDYLGAAIRHAHADRLDPYGR